MSQEKSKVDASFATLEHVFSKYKNAKSHESNRFPLGDDRRVEADLTEIEKAHLSLLQAKLNVEVAAQLNSTILKASEESDRLGKKVFWLNVVMAALTIVIAISASIELSQ